MKDSDCIDFLQWSLPAHDLPLPPWRPQAKVFRHAASAG